AVNRPATGDRPTAAGRATADRLPSRRRRPAALLAGLTVLLVVAALVAAGTGQVPVSPAEVIGSITHRIGLDWGPLPAAPQGDNALWQVRFPRVCLAIVVGASLGCGGALMQGVFGNPLAEPGVVGVSAGA